MPTAGEARLAKKKNINERSVRKPIKKAGASLSTASKVNKSAQIKTQKNRILTKKHGKENIEPKKQGTKAKPAPDFSKLHGQWNSKFQKGKAVAKKSNTKVSPFVLTEVQTYNPLSSKSSDSSEKENTEEEEEEEQEDDFGFEIDNNALQGILNNTGIQVQQDVHPQTRNTYAGPQKSAPNTITGVPTKRTSIYYTGSKKTPTTNQQPLQPKALTSNRPVFGFHAKLGKKQVVWTDQDNNGDDDEISFKPDASALESILNNKGIDERQTLGVRHTMGSTRPVSFIQSYKRQSVIDNQSSKRTSIYYTGSKSKSITRDLPRPSLIGRPLTSVIEKITVPFSQRTAMTPSLKQQYVPGSTVIGHQDGEIENKGFEINTFVKPFTPSRQETIKQVSKTTDVKPCLTNPLMTPSRGKLDTRTQAPSTSKKQVSWSDILTPHRGVDHVKHKDVMHIASMDQTEPANSLPSSELVDSSPWMMSATKPAYPTTQGESPIDDDTVALKLFSDDDLQEKMEGRKEKLELEELERQAIEELKLLEVEENKNSKESCKGFDNNTQARLLSNISGCEPLTSPFQISNTPRNLQRTDLTDQWIRTTPQNHMRVTIRNKTPIASPLVRHMGTPGSLDPRYRTVPVASPRPFVNPANVMRPFERGIQAPSYTAPKVTPFVSHTGQGPSGGAHPIENVFQAPTRPAPRPTHFMSQTGQGPSGGAHQIENVFQGPTGPAPRPTHFMSQTGQRLTSDAFPSGRPAYFTPTQQVVQTPVMNAPSDTGQPSFGLMSSIKKNAPEIGSKRPHSSSVAVNPSFHKSLSWGDTFYSSTPGIEVTSSFQEHSTATNEYPSYSSLHRNGLPTNVYQPLNIPTTSHPTNLHNNNFYRPTEIPSSSIPAIDINEHAGKPLTSNFYQPAEPSFPRFQSNAFQKPEGNPWTSLHGNNYSEPAERPITRHHGNHFYMQAEKPLDSIYSNKFSKPAEKPLTSINERSLYGGSNADRLHLGGSGNDNVYSNGVSGYTQRAYMSGHIPSKTDTAPLYASAPVAMTNPRGNGHTGSNPTNPRDNGHTGSNSTYTNCSTMGKGTVVSIHSPAFIRQQPRMCSDTNFSINPDHLSQRPGTSNVACENRKIFNTVNLPNTSRINPNKDSLSLRSAVGPVGFHRREPVRIQREVTPTVQRRKEGTMSKENYTSSQNKSVGVRLPRSIETHNTLAQEALLDTEVALYTALGVRIKKKCTRDLSNPLAKIFEEGDSQHIIPICVCSDKIYCSVHPVLRSPTLVRRENWS